MNQRSVKVSCVSYLNSTPFDHGLLQHDFAGKLDLSLDIPSVCANKLITGKADIGLVPVAAISDIPGAQRISKWCIGADGPVKSVTLLSSVPLDQIETILLDYHSVTSVNLTKVLAKCFWKIKPVWINAKEGFEKNVVGTTAAVIIGDRSLEMQHLFPYVYDLAGEWKNYTEESATLLTQSEKIGLNCNVVYSIYLSLSQINIKLPEILFQTLTLFVP